MIDNKGYRKNVGIVLMNNKNQFLIFKRIGADAWQFPQGGIDKNETLESALYRELFEETGLTKKDVIFNNNFNKLYFKFCPGPLTFILKKRKNQK